ncbi:MAG: radical SAM protein, partial [Muribaculaceae bacterium]|nr:radical SAM protein [Muribaculaceae bacterium]
MKNSQYNTIYDFPNGRSVIYNAFTDTFIVFPTTQIIRRDPLNPENKVLMQQLVDNGMLIDEDYDEVQALKDKIRKIDNNDSHFHLHVNPTLSCNFRCWYCYENHRSSYMQAEMVENVKKLIANKIKEDKVRTFQLSFFGGEPMLYFDKVARPIIEYAQIVCKEMAIDLSVHFTTNGYLINDSIKDFLRDVNVSFQISLDGHRENHNKVRQAPGGSYDVIMDNIRSLAMMRKSIVVRINYTCEKLKDIPYIVEDIKSFPPETRPYIVIDLQQVWQDMNDENKVYVRERIEEVISSLREDGISATAPLHCDNVNHSCYADKRNHILLNYDGLIYFCTARDFIPENSVGIL